MPPRDPILLTRARRLRREETEAERKLWECLRARQIHGAKFRRQHPIGKYIVDLCCPEHWLVVELDGGHHAEQVAADQRRTAFLDRQGYRVLRFWDNEVLTQIDGVLERIAEAVRESQARPLTPHPGPLPGGEREMK
jgi:very-short-patch-repair endonuclease